MWWKLFNIALYQAIWFLCVLGGTTGSIAALGLVGLHLILSPVRLDDLRMVVILLAVGCLLDGGLQFFGILQFTTTGTPIPLWLAVIWMGLGLLIHHSLGWMKGKYLLCACFGALGGPLAYVGGVSLGAASFGIETVWGVLILGLLWAGLWPWLMHLANKQSSSVILEGKNE